MRRRLLLRPLKQSHKAGVASSLSEDSVTLNRPVNFVLYDGDCPVCSAYVAMSSLRRLRPDFSVINAREDPDLVAQMRALGFEVNESFLVRLDGHVYSGGAATRLISSLGSGNPLIRRVALYVIGGGPWAEALYPWLRSGRNTLLRLLGRPLIP